MCIKINKIGKQEVGIWWVQKCFPRYGVPIWSLWPNIRFLPSIVAEKGHKLYIGTPYRGKRFWTHRIPTSCLLTLLIFIHIEHICSFFVAFFSATIDGRNLIFGHKLHIGTPILWEAFFEPSDSYFLFAKERGYHMWALAHSSSCSVSLILRA
jgi:hypothetical protein